MTIHEWYWKSRRNHMLVWLFLGVAFTTFINVINWEAATPKENIIATLKALLLFVWLGAPLTLVIRNVGYDTIFRKKSREGKIPFLATVGANVMSNEALDDWNRDHPFDHNASDLAAAVGGLFVVVGFLPSVIAGCIEYILLLPFFPLTTAYYYWKSRRNRKVWHLAIFLMVLGVYLAPVAVLYVNYIVTTLEESKMPGQMTENTANQPAAQPVTETPEPAKTPKPEILLNGYDLSFGETMELQGKEFKLDSKALPLIITDVSGEDPDAIIKVEEKIVLVATGEVVGKTVPEGRYRVYLSEDRSVTGLVSFRYVLRQK